MSRLRLPLRLARREVRRRPGRTLLVALLVALPVAGMAMAVTIIRTNAQTPDEEWQRAHGQADAIFYEGPVSLDLLPEGSRALEVATSFVRLKTVGGFRSSVDLTTLPLADPMVRGIYEVVEGRPARDPGEVAFSSAALRQLHAEVGDDIVFERPDQRVTVVGEVEAVGCLSCTTMLLPPGTDLQPFTPLADGRFTTTLVDLPDDVDEATLRAMRQGLGVVDLPHLFPSGPAERSTSIRWSFVLGAVTLTVAGIVISAAFAVGARRQLVTLGQLSASGAPPSTVRAALALQGSLTGAVGVLGGLALAAVLLQLGRGAVEGFLDERVHGYDARLTDLLGVAALGIVAATLAALLPARSAARIPTLAALAGRRPLAPVSRRLLSWGFGGVAVGLGLLFLAALGSRSGSSGEVWAMVAILGGVLELLGACAIAPAIVARLEPLSRHLRGSLRLGARSLARHRARTGAVVSAVAAAAGLAVVSAALVLAYEEESGRSSALPTDAVSVRGESYNPSTAPVTDVPEGVLAELRELLPGAVELGLLAADPASGPAGGIGYWEGMPTATGPTDGYIGDDRALLATPALLESIDASDELRDRLADTGLVVITTPEEGEGYEGGLDVTLPDGRQVDGVAVRHEPVPGYFSNFLVSDEKAAELDLVTSGAGFLFRLPEPLTESQRDGLEDVLFDVESAAFGPTTTSYVRLEWGQERSGPSPFQLELILSAIALGLALFVVGVSLALAAAESKDERDVLTIAGAPPGALARSAGARGWLLSVIGAVMAVPIGFLPVVVFSTATARDRGGINRFPIVFPTRTVLLLVVVLPAIVCAVSWAASGAAQRLRPVRVSTAAFE